MKIETSRELKDYQMEELTRVSFHNNLKSYEIESELPGIIVSNDNRIVAVSTDLVSFGISIMNWKPGIEMYIIAMANNSQMQIKFIPADSKISVDIAGSYNSENIDKETACAKSCEELRDAFMDLMDDCPTFIIRYLTDLRFIDSASFNSATIRNRIYYGLTKVLEYLDARMSPYKIIQKLTDDFWEHYCISVYGEFNEEAYTHGDQANLLSNMEPMKELSDKQYDELVALSCFFHINQRK